MPNELTELLDKGGAAPAEPGKSLAEILKDVGGAVWDGAAKHVEHGSAELMSALFIGNSYVPYGWSHASEGQETTHGLSAEASVEPQQKEVEREM